MSKLRESQSSMLKYKNVIQKDKGSGEKMYKETKLLLSMITEYRGRRIMTPLILNVGTR
jgi:hypothetical protein